MAVSLEELQKAFEVIKKAEPEVLKDLEAARLSSANKDLNEIANSLGEGDESLQELVNLLENEGEYFKGSVASIVKQNEILSKSEKEVDRIAKAAEITNKYLIAMQGNLRNIFMELAADSPNAMAMVNIFTAIFDMFTRFEESLVESRRTLIDSYAAVGGLDNLGLMDVNNILVPLRDAGIKYGLAEGEAEEGIKAFAAAGAKVDMLFKEAESFKDGNNAVATDLYNTILASSTLLSQTFAEMAGYTGKMVHDFGATEQDLVSNLRTITQQQAQSGINATHFTQAIQQASEANFLYADYTKESALYLGYLAKSTTSTAQALQLFQMATESDPGLEFRIMSLQNVFNKDDAESQKIAKDIKESLETQKAKAKTGSAREKTLTYILSGFSTDESGKLRLKFPQMYAMAKNNILTHIHKQLLDSAFLQGKVDESNIAIYAQALNRDLVEMTKIMHTPISSLLEVSKKARESFAKGNIGLQEFLKGAENLGNQRTSSMEKLKQKLKNTLENKFGDPALSASMALKTVLDTLTSSSDFLRFFGSDMTKSQVYDILFTKIQQTYPNSKMVNWGLGYLRAAMIGDVELVEQRGKDAITLAENMQAMMAKDSRILKAFGVKVNKLDKDSEYFNQDFFKEIASQLSADAESGNIGVVRTRLLKTLGREMYGDVLEKFKRMQGSHVDLEKSIRDTGFYDGTKDLFVDGGPDSVKNMNLLVKAITALLKEEAAQSRREEVEKARMKGQVRGGGSLRE